MTFNEYQKLTEKFDMAPAGEGQDWHYALGLGGETGEVLEKIKKKYRVAPHNTPIEAKAMAKELGDVLWYLARLADYYGYMLEEVAEMNIEKLQDRADRNVLKGNGDDR